MLPHRVKSRLVAATVESLIGREQKTVEDHVRCRFVNVQNQIRVQLKLLFNCLRER